MDEQKGRFLVAQTLGSCANTTDTIRPPEYCDSKWYAVCTKANQEKRVAKQFDVRQVEHFLPTFSSLRRWKDRRVMLDLPLFPGYVFARLALRNRLGVIQVPGVARFVTFGGIPAPLPDEQIEALRSGFLGRVRAEPHPFLKIGRRVRVKVGPLAGMEGILVRRKGSLRVVISIDLIQRAVAVEMDEIDVEVPRN